jgi:hypothetical protein
VQDAASVVCLKAALARADVPDTAEQQALSADIEHVAARYGSLVSVEVPGPAAEGEEGEEAAEWIGDVLLRYASAHAARRAAEALAGRFFGEAPLTAVLQPAG